MHLDDFSEIPVIGRADNSRILQQRARLRAAEGDWVAQSRTIERGYSDYCEYHLGLGRVHWLYPATDEHDTRHIALRCWQDRRLRHDLIQAIRHDGLRYIHPHISTLHVWELATRLGNATRMPISVIGPTPAMSRWANNKIEFTRTVARLLGRSIVPHTESAYNLAMLSKKVQRLAATNERLCVKFPYGTGGHGNFVIESRKIRNDSLSQVRNYLKEMLDEHRWPKEGQLLIDVWEDNVCGSPSVQTWIPAAGSGEPVIEGIFDQVVTQDIGKFIGSSPARLAPQLKQQIGNQSYLLALLFQQLGYVGRCSFDLILVGSEPDKYRVEFIECNARWGGTSSPMTLVNRLRIREQQKTYGIRSLTVDGLHQLEFAVLRRRLANELYHRSSRKGHYLLFNPARIQLQSAIEVIAVGDTPAEVDELLSRHLPLTLGQLVGENNTTAPIRH